MSSRSTCPQGSVQVICLGLSRTGTTSLSVALDILGLGPCYHTYRLQVDDGRNFDLYPWIEILQSGTASPEKLDQILTGYCSVLDEPAALFPEALYKAYPGAKFILTTRDPGKWERSMRETLFPAIERRLADEPRTEMDRAWMEWCSCKVQKLQPDILNNPKATLLRHNEHIKAIVPPEQLLVFDVTDGWGRLVEFLGVPEPELPFPYLNDTGDYRKSILQPLLD